MSLVTVTVTFGNFHCVEKTPPDKQSCRGERLYLLCADTESNQPAMQLCRNSVPIIVEMAVQIALMMTNNLFFFSVVHISYLLSDYGVTGFTLLLTI